MLYRVKKAVSTAGHVSVASKVMQTFYRMDQNLT